MARKRCAGNGQHIATYGHRRYGCDLDGNDRLLCQAQVKHGYRKWTFVYIRCNDKLVSEDHSRETVAGDKDLKYYFATSATPRHRFFLDDTVSVILGIALWSTGFFVFPLPTAVTAILYCFTLHCARHVTLCRKCGRNTRVRNGRALNEWKRITGATNQHELFKTCAQKVGLNFANKPWHYFSVYYAYGNIMQVSCI